MPRTLISSGSTFEQEIGYSRAVVQGDWVFVSGTTGFDYATMDIAPGIEAQTEQCLRNIEAALQQPVVQRLLALIRLRNTHPAFGGHFELLDSAEHRLHLRWTQGVHRAELEVDLRQPSHRITTSD